MNTIKDDVDTSPSSDTHIFQIPQINGESDSISLSSGDILFVLGANGSGKSGLMQHIHNKHTEQTRWISALRQTFFVRDFQILGSLEKQSTEDAIRGRETSPEYRWTDDYARTKPNLWITDLINMERVRSQEITRLVDARNKDRAMDYSSEHQSPLEIVNQLLKQSNIPVTLKLENYDTVLASKNQSEPYSIAQLSDGERAVILIASRILSAPPNTLVLIDEPERHLHQSIVSPFLKALFAKRPDCAFIIATHEVDIPMDNRDSRILLVHDCAHSGKFVVGWDTVLVESKDNIDESLMRDILGARRKLLFVEGEKDSLDNRVYSLIFPKVTIIPKGSFKDVIKAVSGIRSTKHLHRIDAYGIIDRDGRSKENVEKLQANGIYSLDVYIVESIYYEQQVRTKVAEQHSKVTGSDAVDKLACAEMEALKAIERCADYLSRKVADHKIDNRINNDLPKLRNYDPYESAFCICVQVDDIMDDVYKKLKSAIEKLDLDYILAHYPVKNSNALQCIAKGLEFPDRRTYEQAVLTLLKDDSIVLDHLRSLFNPLYNILK